MQSRKKSIRLILILVILVTGNLALWSYQPSSGGLDYDPDFFKVMDTTSIESFTMVNNKGEVHMSRSSGFRVNDKYAVDQSMLRLMMAVFNRIQISRKLGPTGAKEVLQQMEEEGATIRLAHPTEEKVFSVVGNSTQTATYFASDEEVFVVEIPGYRDYLGNLFQLDEDQWRDRVVTTSNWRTIQQITIQHQDGDVLEINFSDSFFLIPGIPELDSNRVVEYLNEFEYLQGNERIRPGKYGRYDSLARLEADVSIRIDDIQSKDLIELKIYNPLPEESYQLMIDSNGEMILLDERRIDALLVKKEDFSYNKR